MKIIIQDLWFNWNEEIRQKLEPLLVKTMRVCDLYTDESIFRMENGKRFHRIEIHDGSIETYTDYIDGKTILIDKSIVKTQMDQAYHIPIAHTKLQYTQYYYRLREKSPIYLVIEIMNDSVSHSLSSDNNELKDVFVRFEDNYAAYSDADVENPFTKETINSFLSLVSNV